MQRVRLLDSLRLYSGHVLYGFQAAASMPAIRFSQRAESVLGMHACIHPYILCIYLQLSSRSTFGCTSTRASESAPTYTRTCIHPVTLAHKYMCACIHTYMPAYLHHAHTRIDTHRPEELCHVLMLLKAVGHCRFPRLKYLRVTFDC